MALSSDADYTGLRRFWILAAGGLLWISGSILTAGVDESADSDIGRLEIVDRSIEYHGGEVFTQSRSQLQVCSKSGCYLVRTRIDGDSFEIEASGKVREQMRRVSITNDTVEFWLDGEAVEVEPDRTQSARNWVMARAYFVYLPFRLNDDSVIRQDLGTEVWDGRSLRKIKVTFVTGSSSGADDEFLYWFDPETARLEQFAYSFAGNPGGLRFRRAFNYRRVGGILFFDQENWGVDEDGLRVEEIHPDRLADWDLISTVTVQEIKVEPLAR